MSRDVTIARVIARLNVGGPSIQAILMTDAFAQRGYRALLLTGEVAQGEASMEYLAEANNVKPIKLSTMSRKIAIGRDIASLWRLIKILRREKPLVIHTHTAKAGTLGRLAAIATRIPVRVHTFHGHVFDGYFSRPMTQLCLMIERLLARTTDRIVAISESQSKELTGKYKIARNDKVVTIPLGFNIDPFLNVEKNDPSSSLSETISTDTVRIGWIGRFTAIKAPELLLDCACLVRDAELPARFFVVGDGELRSTCERRIREQRLEDVVKILGWQRDLPPIYANLDFVVSTSINEGTPVNLLESMASACPFVATNVGGVSDLMVGDGKTIDGMTIFKNGILVPRDAEVLLRAVQYLVERPSLRKSMGLVGREFVKDKFSYSRLADDLEKLYLSIAEEKGYLVCSGDLHSYDRIPINLPCVKAPSVSVDSD